MGYGEDGSASAASIMFKLMVLCCALLGGRSLSLPPLELNVTLRRLRDIARHIPPRCVELSVTPVLCTDLSNSDALVAHPDDCQLFYYCETNRAEPTCRQCPAGLHFNPTLHVCDWPQHAGCTTQPPTTTPATTTETPNTTEHSFNSTTTPNLTSTTELANVTWAWPWLPTTNASNATDGPAVNTTTIASQWNSTTSGHLLASTETWPWPWSNLTSNTMAPEYNSTIWLQTNVTSTDQWLSNATQVWTWDNPNNSTNTTDNTTSDTSPPPTHCILASSSDTLATNTTAGRSYTISEPRSSESSPTTVRWRRLN